MTDAGSTGSSGSAAKTVAAHTSLRTVTLADVARAAGVSVSTASKALNGRPDVSEGTRARVQSAADQLSFSPNSLARSLVSGRSFTVGLITHDLEGRFSTPILMGAEDAFGLNNISLLLCDARGDYLRERHQVKVLLERRVDGIIVVGADNARPSIGRDVPVPVVYLYAASADPADISLISDNVGAGRLAAEHLIDCGRRRIAILGGDPTYGASPERAEGAMAALAAAGLEPVGGGPLYGSWSEEWGRGGCHALITQYPDTDAIICGSDQVARGALDALRDLGRSVPDDVAVTGHDNWKILVSGSRPPLTSIDMNLEDLGRLGATRLREAIEGHPTPGLEKLACRLVVRGSTVG